MPIDENTSLNDFGQLIVDQIVREHEDFDNRFQAMEKANEELRSSIESTNTLEAIKQSHMETINALNEELSAIKEAYGQLDREKQGLIIELDKRPVQVDRDQITRSPGMVFFILYKIKMHFILFSRKTIIKSMERTIQRGLSRVIVFRKLIDVLSGSHSYE